MKNNNEQRLHKVHTHTETCRKATNPENVHSKVIYAPRAWVHFISWSRCCRRRRNRRHPAPYRRHDAARPCAGAARRAGVGGGAIWRPSAVRRTTCWPTWSGRAHGHPAAFALSPAFDGWEAMRGALVGMSLANWGLPLGRRGPTPCSVTSPWGGCWRAIRRHGDARAAHPGLGIGVGAAAGRAAAGVEACAAALVLAGLTLNLALALLAFSPRARPSSGRTQRIRRSPRRCPPRAARVPACARWPARRSWRR